MKARIKNGVKVWQGMFCRRGLRSGLNRALTSEEVSTIYNNGAGRFYTP